MRPLSATEKSRISAAAEDRRLRIVAIALMCGAMLLFTGLDTSSKWLGLRLPISEIVWARYMGATVFALIAARPWSRPAVLDIEAAVAAGAALALPARLDGVRRDRAAQPATGRDGDDLVPPADPGGSGGGPAARRAGRPRADDRDRVRLSRRADRHPPRNQRLPAGRRDRRRRRPLQRRLFSRDPQARRRRFLAHDARLDAGGRRGPDDALASLDLGDAAVPACLGCARRAWACSAPPGTRW